MKICPICGEVYPDRARACRAHETSLLDWEEVTDAHTDVHTDVDLRRLETDLLVSDAVAGEIDVPTGGLARRSNDTPRVYVSGETKRNRAPHGGRVLGGRYRLDKHIGVGGYGAVFAGFDLRDEQRIAVKVLSPAAAQNPELMTRFHREAIAASRVDHPHIVEVSDFDVDDDGTHFIVMEYLGGADLSEILDDCTKLEPVRALMIAAQCASALSAAHRAGIIHRDLKPANLFLVDTGSHRDFVKIIDFGITKLTRAAGQFSDLTSASKVVGTPCYMSPEQATGEQLDGRCDVYGLGIVLYEMLTGERPFTGRSAIEILTKHVEAPRVAPSAECPALAELEGIDQLVLEAIAARPRQRYASMDEFGAAISDCLERLDSDVARMLDGAMSMDSTTTPRLRLTTHVPRPRVAPRRRRAGLALSVVVALAAAIVFWVLRPDGGDERAANASKPAPPSTTSEPAPPKPPPRKVARTPEKTTPDKPAPVRRSVTITSTPSGASVYRGRRKLGVTPVEVPVSTQPLLLSLRAPGHRVRKIRVHPTGKKMHVRLVKRRIRTPKPTIGIQEW